MTWLACCLYVAIGSAMMSHDGAPAAHQYWLHDINAAVNPYGIAEVGWERIFGRVTVTVAARHMSSLGIDWDSSCFCKQQGLNTAELRLQWFPGRAH